MKKALVVFLCAGCAVVNVTLAEQSAPSAKPAVHAASPHHPVDLERLKQALTDNRRKMFASARLDLAQKYVDSFAGASGIADVDISEIVDEMATLQKQNVDLRLKYFGICLRKIDARTAGRFALVDDYVTTSLRLDLLSQIPFPGDEAAK